MSIVHTHYRYFIPNTPCIQHIPKKFIIIYHFKFLIKSWYYAFITYYIQTDVISLIAWYLRVSKVFSDNQCPWMHIILSEFCNALKKLCLLPDRGIRLAFVWSVRTISGVNPASYTMANKQYFPWGEATRAWSWALTFI